MKKFISFLVAVMLVFFETDTYISAYTAENPDFPELSYNENISYSDYYDLYCNSSTIRATLKNFSELAT